MIIGYFENGRPHVSAHVEIRRLNIRDTIPLLVDSGTCQAADGRVNHGKPISESRPSRRTFNTPNAAGVSRDTDAGPD